MFSWTLTRQEHHKRRSVLRASFLASDGNVVFLDWGGNSTRSFEVEDVKARFVFNQYTYTHVAQQLMGKFNYNCGSFMNPLMNHYLEMTKFEDTELCKEAMDAIQRGADDLLFTDFEKEIAVWHAYWMMFFPVDSFILSYHRSNRFIHVQKNIIYYYIRIRAWSVSHDWKTICVHSVIFFCVSVVFVIVSKMICNLIFYFHPFHDMAFTWDKLFHYFAWYSFRAILENDIAFPEDPISASDLWYDLIVLNLPNLLLFDVAFTIWYDRIQFFVLFYYWIPMSFVSFSFKYLCYPTKRIKVIASLGVGCLLFRYQPRVFTDATFMFAENIWFCIILLHERIYEDYVYIIRKKITDVPSRTKLFIDHWFIWYGFVEPWLYSVLISVGLLLFDYFFIIK